MEKLFVYGMLRQGGPYHHMLMSSRRTAMLARVEDAGLVDTGFGYPGLILSTPGYTAGELYTVDAHTLRLLDRFEVYYGPKDPRNLYERIDMPVRTDSGVEQAWVYIYNRSTAGPSLPFGEWELSRLRGQNEIFYWAYGSCMDLVRIEQAGQLNLFQKVCGRAEVSGVNLQFTWNPGDGGRADIVETGGITEGKLYLIRSAAIEYLYEREGVWHDIYRPVVISVRRPNGETVSALTFVVVNKQPISAPPSEYAAEILRGARPIVSRSYYHQLSDYIDRLME